MATFADLFKACYLTGGSGVDFSSVRLNYRGADRICRAGAADGDSVVTGMCRERRSTRSHGRARAAPAQDRA